MAEMTKSTGNAAAIALRLLLFAASLTGLVVLVTSKQTELIPTGLPPPFSVIPRDAKFKYSPALIYLLVALALTCLYSIITLVASLSKSSTPRKLFLLILLDTVMAGVTASAAGSSGAIAYLGLKGNSHTNWNKICNVYDKFCKHIGSSAALSLVSSIVLVILVALSAHHLYRLAGLAN